MTGINVDMLPIFGLKDYRVHTAQSNTQTRCNPYFCFMLSLEEIIKIICGHKGTGIAEAFV